MLELVRSVFNPLSQKLKPHPALEKLMQTAHLGVWYWPLNNDIAYLSPTFYNLFDINPKKFSPTLEALEALVNLRDATRLRALFEGICQQRSSTHKTLEFDLEHPFDVEKTFHVRLFASPYYDEKTNALVGILGLVQDITQKKRQKKALKNALDVAESANATKARFLAAMSHELRTPLNAIIGFSEMMQAELLGPLGNPRYADYATSIHDSGRHLLDLINDVLDMSKIEAGKYELHFEPVNLYKALRACCHMVSGHALEKQHHLYLPPESEIPQTLWVDSRALTQIMMNLLSNAIKYTKNGGEIKLKVTSQHGQHVDIEVIDNGVGIPAAFLPRIGNAFEQFDTQGLARSQQGSGLGLAITKRLAEMHGGSLFIESQENVGTRVVVSLPLFTRQLAENTHPYAVQTFVDLYSDHNNS